MASKTWVGGTTAVAQVDTFTNSNTGGGTETWTWTVTGEDGTTATATFVDDGTPTTAELYTGLVAAWNNSKHPYFTPVTAAGSTPVITLTADTAGTPFYVTLTASGTGAYTKASTTPNVGPYDWNTAANWVEGVVPVATNHVLITGSNKIIYGLRQGSVAINGFTVVPTYTGIIGGPGKPLVIDPDIFNFAGTGISYIDIGSAAIAVSVTATATPSSGAAGLYLLGSGITTLSVTGGTVAVATASGETATITTAQCSGAGVVYLGSGLTLTTFHLVSGTGYLSCAATTVNADSGTLYTLGTGAITTLNNGSALGGSTSYLSSTGTITTLNAKGGTIDFSKSDIARTVTTLNHYNGCSVKRNPSYITVTTYTQSDASTLTAA